MKYTINGIKNDLIMGAFPLGKSDAAIEFQTRSKHVRIELTEEQIRSLKKMCDSMLIKEDKKRAEEAENNEGS